MKLMTTNGRRAVAALLLTAFVTSMVAPAAEAGSRKRYKGGHARSSRVVVHSYPQRVYVRDHGVAPVIAFLGGLVIGASVAHASHPDDYYYYDPYCETRYASLEVYHSHAYRHHHPRMVRVIQVSSGRCVDSYRYHDGHWYSRDRWDDRWDDGDRYDRDRERYDRDGGWDDGERGDY